MPRSVGSVVETIEEFLPFYAGVHRGTGYKSRLRTNTFERARELVGGFFGADPDRDVVVFTKNTTEALNKLARSLPMPADSVMLTTLLEHHSNDLPWRGRVRTVHVGARPDGALDLDDLHGLRRLLGAQDVRAIRHWCPCRTPLRVRSSTASDRRWARCMPSRLMQLSGQTSRSEEAGSPNVIGAIALAAATRALVEIGFDRIADHEIELTRYATRRLSKFPGLTIHGPSEGVGPTAKAQRLGRHRCRRRRARATDRRRDRGCIPSRP